MADEHISLALANSAVSLPGQRADELGSPLAAANWLIDHSLVPGDTTLLAYCQNQLTGLREDVRGLFTALLVGVAPHPSTLDGINHALTKGHSPPLLRHGPERGLHMISEHPVTQLVEHAMARITEDAAALATG